MSKSKLKSPTEPLRLDLGCGPNRKPSFIGVDRIKFPNVDVVLDLRTKWPWKEGSVEEIHCSHTIEHFDAIERVHVYNEMFRVMKVGAKATIIAPHWNSGRAYGDPTHRWPPICGFSYFYLLKSWRMANAPHTDRENWPFGYACDFDATWGFALHPEIQARNPEYQAMAAQFYCEATPDIIATITKRDVLK